MSKNGNPRKRPAPPQKTSPAQAPKHQAASQEDEFVDEDVFLDETLILEEEILRDIEDRQALACRLAKWVRPPLSDGYVSQSRSIREWLSAYFTRWILLC
jgi:DNA polymerase delta subunit 1